MGVLDFLSDLSKARSKDELGLGGMRSLLGTRGAAPQGKRGDEMMSRTSSDSLPGYFDPETREYVPWYVDLFDGGGLNKSEGLLSNAQKVTTAVDMLNTNGAPVQRAGQMAPGSDMPNTGMTGIPGYTLPQSDMPNTGMTGIPGYTLPQSDMPNTGMTGIPGYTLPSSMQVPVESYASSQQGVMPQMQDNMPVGTAKPRDSTLNTLRGKVYSVGPIEALINAFTNSSDTPLAQSPSTQVLAPAQSGQSVPASGGNMAINTPAAQGRDQMIADQQMLVEEQAMKNHPLYSEYVDFLNQYNLKSVPGLFERYLKTTGAL